jgi:hypothetical protein
VVKSRLIVVLAGTAALAVAPSCALAQGAFPDYRQAAADQYPQQPPPGNSGSSGPPSGQPGSTNGHNGGHNGSGGNGRNRKGTAGSRRRNGHAVLGTSVSGGRAPVAVPTRPVPAAKGSLPFTGSDLSGLVVLALLLIAAGLFAGALSRATRRRRRATA